VFPFCHFEQQHSSILVSIGAIAGIQATTIIVIITIVRKQQFPFSGWIDST
jgi:hypothetical protein